MSKFEYMGFSDGGCHDSDFVAHAKKYTKKEALEILKDVYDYNFSDGLYREPTESDFTEDYIRWYVRVPEWCGYDGDNGCYSFCGKSEKGGFPVWRCELSKLVK